MHNDSVEILSVPVPILKTGFSFFNLLRYTLLAWITNPRDRVLSNLYSKSLINDFSRFDHVVEASIKIQSKILQILDCPHSKIEIETEIENGEYRVRIYSINLESSYEEIPNDTYKIEMWKEAYSERDVLKRHLG